MLTLLAILCQRDCSNAPAWWSNDCLRPYCMGNIGSRSTSCNSVTPKSLLWWFGIPRYATTLLANAACVPTSRYSYSPPFAVHLHMHAKITLTLDSYHRKFSPPRDTALFIQLSPCFCTQLAWEHAELIALLQLLEYRPYRAANQRWFWKPQQTHLRPNPSRKPSSHLNDYYFGLCVQMIPSNCDEMGANWSSLPQQLPFQ